MEQGRGFDLSVEGSVTREVAEPGWRWSTHVRPMVGTEWCRAFHQLFIVSGRLHVLMDDGSEQVLAAGDAAVVSPGHDAWVIGDEPCESVDFSMDYAKLIDAGAAYNELSEAGGSGTRSRNEVTHRLRERAQRGELDGSAVELVLGAVARREGRHHRPAGLTPREAEVLILIATGASAPQVAAVLGISAKTASNHIERIYDKCQVSTRSEATRFAIGHGMVKPLTT